MAEPPPPLTHRIPARNRRQAIDWSLVLASQGIEHGIEHLEETGWALTIAESVQHRGIRFERCEIAIAASGIEGVASERR